MKRLNYLRVGSFSVASITRLHARNKASFGDYSRNVWRMNEIMHRPARLRGVLEYVRIRESTITGLRSRVILCLRKKSISPKAPSAKVLVGDGGGQRNRKELKNNSFANLKL